MKRLPIEALDRPPSRTMTTTTHAKLGAIFLQASISVFTAAADFSNAARSLPERSISTTRSTPFSPITTGTKGVERVVEIDHALDALLADHDRHADIKVVHPVF